MFKIFSTRRRPTEVVCYPAKYTVIARIAGQEETIVEGYGDSFRDRCLDFIEWFDNDISEVFVGYRRCFGSVNDLRVVRRHVSEVLARSLSGGDYYKNMR